MEFSELEKKKLWLALQLISIQELDFEDLTKAELDILGINISDGIIPTIQDIRGDCAEFIYDCIIGIRKE